MLTCLWPLIPDIRAILYEVQALHNHSGATLHNPLTDLEGGKETELNTSTHTDQLQTRKIVNQCVTHRMVGEQESQLTTDIKYLLHPDHPTESPTSQIHNFIRFLHFNILSHPSDAEILAQRLIGTCNRLSSLT